MSSTGNSPGWDNDHFTLANIPYGIASAPGHPKLSVATRLHGDVYFLEDLIKNDLIGPFPSETVDALSDQHTLNAFASLPKTAHHEVRLALKSLLSHQTQQALGSSRGDALSNLRYPVNTVTLHLPVSVGDFSDFSCSRDHVLNAGEAVQGVRALPPGFLHFPVGYTGRSSSIVVSGTPIIRPWGQAKSRETGEVSFGPSRAMDFELEVAAVVARPTKLGQRVRIDDADEYIFGLILLNDWSARDIQGLEMNPLGPFNGKSLGTTVSPWVIPLDALQANECAGPQLDAPRPAYLQDPKAKPSYAVHLQVDLIPNEQSAAVTICRSRLEWLYYTFRDLVAHQTINGCPLRTGDLLATGTVSGSEEGTLGCLLEITKGGKKPLQLPDGSSRVYLQDGDSVRLTAWAGELGSEQCVGFGEAYGQLQAAHDF